MADLLGSILGSMQKPPSVGSSEEKKKAKEQQRHLEKLKIKEKEKLNDFKTKIQDDISSFMKDSVKEKHQFKPMDKVFRAIIHEVADVAGLTSFSFGEDEVDRYVMIWKKEFAPTDEELAAYRRGEEWDAEKAKQEAKLKEMEQREAQKAAAQRPSVIVPASNYKDKYEHLIGKEAAKDAAKITLANKAYGFVSSENKRDKRTIEEVMAENRARKKLKAAEEVTGPEANPTAEEVTGPEANPTTERLS